MYTNRRAFSAISAILLLATLTPACLKKSHPGSDADAGDDAGDDADNDGDGGGDLILDAQPDTAPTPTPARDAAVDTGAPLGASCLASSDCSSHFCVDSVCCNTACLAPCFSCNQPVTPGACSPLFGVEDVFASPACSGTRICSDDIARPAACVLVHPPGPLGASCTAPTDCASNFCVDSVCCNSTCTSPCFSCNQTIALGTCLPIYGAEDPSAIPTCSGTRSCSNNTAAPPACKLSDGQECVHDADCVSNHCRTYFFDGDHDGYGVTTNSISICDATPNPPAPYVSTGGDCCDTDPMANPAVPLTFWSPTADACGSYDWNCSGMPEPQRACPGNASLPCGQKCIGPLNLVFFVAACH